MSHSPAQIDFSQASTLTIDAEREVDRIASALREQVGTILRRRGAVVAMSGGIDSSVSAALAVRALGPSRVFGLFMPERDSDSESLRLASALAAHLQIDAVTEDIAPILAAAGCYRRRDEAIRRVMPEYGDGWRCKLVLPGNRLNSDRLNVSSLVVQSPGGESQTLPLPADVYRQIVAATNFKQRTRKMLEYYHADRLHYAVVGTPNRLEHDQGFFVKGGDGLADVKPIAHLYKTQVYQLAEYLGIPAGITSRPPTTDTFSLPQSQEEFYFSLPVREMDLLLHARNSGESAATTAARLGCAVEQVERAFRDIDQKRLTTRYLHQPPILVEPRLATAAVEVGS
jgi:NAD+ synthase